jgi:hypothetical protein
MARFAGALLAGLVQLAPFDKLSIGGFMTTTNFLVPLPEQIDEWFDDAVRLNSTPKYYIARQAAQWGADQELEACCEWLDTEKILTKDGGYIRKLRAARRPNPPRLKEQALHELNDVYNRDKIDDSTYDTIRRALEALDD